MTLCQSATQEGLHSVLDVSLGVSGAVEQSGQSGKGAMPLADLQEERIELVQGRTCLRFCPSCSGGQEFPGTKVIPHSSITPSLKCFGEGALLTRDGSDDIPGLFQL